jgi:hypothetical protein
VHTEQHLPYIRSVKVSSVRRGALLQTLQTDEIFSVVWQSVTPCIRCLRKKSSGPARHSRAAQTRSFVATRSEPVDHDSTASHLRNPHPMLAVLFTPNGKFGSALYKYRLLAMVWATGVGLSAGAPCVDRLWDHSGVARADILVVKAAGTHFCLLLILRISESFPIIPVLVFMA